MTLNQYKALVSLETEEYNIALRAIGDRFARENGKYNIGDYIYNVTGILKIEAIKCELFGETPNIKYFGYPYKKRMGKLSRTKKNNMISMLELNISGYILDGVNKRVG